MSITFYCCQTDFNWEIGETLGGNTIYSSLEDLQANENCWSSCGVYKITLIEQPEQMWTKEVIIQAARFNEK